MFKKQQVRLRARGSRTAAAFLQAFPEMLAVVAAAYVVFRVSAVVADDILLTVLRILILVLAAVYWAIRFLEYRKAEE